ncbi:transposase [Streptomyces sp. 2A115]|uniref:transposase n=1 Tax=Streptomyces sp. 2A115 TaxID=3457439 RepID=UPI003FD1B2EA
MDAQSVRAAATVSAASRGYDGGKKVPGRKRHIVTDTLLRQWPHHRCHRRPRGVVGRVVSGLRHDAGHVTACPTGALRPSSTRGVLCVGRSQARCVFTIVRSTSRAIRTAPDLTSPRRSRTRSADCAGLRSQV